MNADIYRYEFDPTIPAEELEGSMLLALWAAEALHGETELEISAPHYIDLERRRCVIDTCSGVGRDLNRLFAGFVRQEFGSEAFQVSRVPHRQAADARTAA